MKRSLSFLLGVSLAANAWLLWRGPARSRPAVPDRSVAVVAPSHGVTIAALETGDAAGIRDALRADGADESTVRAVVEGVLRQRQRGKLAAERIERARHAWWRNGRRAQAGEAKLTQETVTEPLQRLLGPDPLETMDAESRYSFLPPEKRGLLAQIDRDYAEMQARRPANLSNAQLRAAAREEQLLTDERRKDVLAALSPPEREEYDLRFSETAGQVSRRMATMGATEAEYRAVKPLIDAFDRASQALPKADKFPVEVYNELQRTTSQQLVAALGYDRALEYFWSGYDAEYAALRRATESAGLPGEMPVRVMELDLATGQEAARIHADPALTPEQKRAALITLRQTAQGRLDALLPPPAQQALPADGLRWLTSLGEGKYLVPMPTLINGGGYSVHSIASPPPAKPDEAPALPVRPPGE
jgi:hypothetical protein